jgi:hypothetical protein
MPQSLSLRVADMERIFDWLFGVWMSPEEPEHGEKRTHRYRQSLLGGPMVQRMEHELT